MPTRRTFFKSAASAAAAVALAPRFSVAARPEPGAAPEPYRSDTPMLELQQRFLDLRFGMFVHFNMATFQDREWGDPDGPTEAFDPTDLDTDQWAACAKSANMGYGCLTTKHHDGFCLWHTKTGVDSVLRTPKKIDVVKRYTDSFRNAGLRVGLYMSILDLRNDIRHNNVTPEKIALIKAQLAELLTNYGEIDVLIFDGWDAPWSRIPYSEVPFSEIYRHIKSIRPNCLISELNAASYPPSALYYSDIKAFEQNAGQALPQVNPIPAQSCVTLTEGWFWKQGDENRPLKPAKQVVEEWLVPQNAQHCNLICNAAPDRTGQFAPNIVGRLKEIGQLWKNPGPAPKVDASPIITTLNLAEHRPIRASASPDTVGPDLANDGRFSSTWSLPDEKKDGWLEVTLPDNTAFNTLVIAEPVGRWKDYPKTRLATYAFEVWADGAWRPIAITPSANPVRIHAIPWMTASKVRLSFTTTGDGPHLSEIGVYDEPRS